MYAHLASVYDYFVDWKNRLNYELPFLIDQISALKEDPHEIEVLDAACGSGQHAIALAAQGFRMSGADLFPEMVSIAQANSLAADQNLNLKTVGFGAMTPAFGKERFDAILCLGNSLPHVLSQQELKNALADFTSMLKPGGLLILQSRNFDKVLKEKQRFMDPQAVDDQNKHYVFFRFYDFLANGLIQFNILTLSREGAQAWQTAMDSTLLYPLGSSRLGEALSSLGFGELNSYGNMAGDPFAPQASPDLVLVAKMPSSGESKAQ